MKRSAEEIRRVEQAINDIEKYWEFNYKYYEIRRKPFGSIAAKLLDFFWKKKNSVWELYRWIQRKQDSVTGIIFENAMQKDDMPVENYPTKYRLLNNWTIPTRDLKYLKDGPLFSENKQKILVQHNTGIEKLKFYFNQYSRIVTTAAATYVIISLIIRNWDYIAGLFK